MPLCGAVKLSIWLQLILAWSPFIYSHVTVEAGEAENTTDLPDGYTPNDGDAFDFIVVGAGAAGCATAARLALLGFAVLLIEAGGNPSPVSKIPSAGMALLGSDIDWQYETIPNNVSCLASRGGQCRFSRGKCLGGSSSINYMLYTRGNRRDYDLNITDWNWEDLRPYFLRYEGLQVLDKFPTSSIPYHNTTGILKMEYFDDPRNPWRSRIINGFRELGFPYNEDVNGVSQIGINHIVGYVYKGERMSTARAYLQRKDVQRALKVAKNTLCTGVIIDDNNVTRGVTVLYEQATKPLQLFARKEVILSAGTIGTPQILMLSGIGPAKYLEEIGIPLRVDLPVGENMSEHVLPLLVILVDRGIKILRDLGNLVAKVGQLAEYLVAHNGPLGSNGLTDVNAFANTLCYDRKRRRLANSSDDCDLPNMQIIHAYLDRNVIPLVKPVFQQGVNLDDDTVDQLASANINKAFIIASPILLTPYSRGYVRLASKDPRTPPAISANFLSDSRDVDLILDSIEVIEHLVQTADFKKNNAKILHLKFPGCPSYEKSREGYWRCYVRYMTYSVFHALGTCSLDRVVDTKLRVKSVQALRVADLSILPTIPRGNTEAPSVAIGERVVDFIKETLTDKDT